MKEEFISNSQADTENFAKKIAKLIANKPCTILLKGNLGAGKTAFSRGFIKEICDDENLIVSSPTFVISYSYKAKNGVEVRHLDLYRLNKPSDIYDLDIEYAFENCITLIEWPEILSGQEPKEYYLVEFEYLSENQRKINIENYKI